MISVRNLVVLVLMLSATAVLGQVAQNGTENPLLATPGFYYDILSFAGQDSAQTRVDVFVQTPFDKIQFIKSNDIYKGELRLTVAVYDEFNLKMISEKSWSEKIDLKDFAQTHSKSNANVTFRSFNLKPGTYNFKLTTEDKDSKRQFRAEKQFFVKTFNQNTSMSDIVLLSLMSAGGNKIVPNISRNVANYISGLPIYYEIKIDNPRDIVVEYQIFDAKNEMAFETKVIKRCKEGVNKFVDTLQFNKINMGEYKLISTIKNEEQTTKIVTTKQFFSRWLGAPATEKDLDLAIDQMVYLASHSDLSIIREGKDYKDKLERFYAWWGKNDPTPGTVENELFTEYYSRVEFANKSFKQLIDGWRTDMGMVYITLGVPNNIERHPFEYDSKPYEIWEYYDINRRFTFYDATGFGEYRLITPFSGEYKFRFRN